MWVVGGLGAVAGVAAVVLALLVEPARSRRDPPTGPVASDDLRRADPPLVWRGYDPAVVDPLLVRAAETIERLTDELERDRGAAETEPPSWLRPALEDGGETPSGEELEDRGGDGAGGLDG